MGLTAFNRMRRIKAQNEKQSKEPESLSDLLDLTSLTLAQLKEFATEKSIDISGVANNKQSILAKIQKALDATR